MKIRIEGCTAEELAAESEYLSVGKIYDARKVRGGYRLYEVIADDGVVINTIVGGQSFHLPDGALWVEVSE